MRSLPMMTLIAALVPVVGAAGDLTVREAVALALEANPAVHAARARAEAATAEADQARGHRLPSVDLMEAFTYTDSPADVFGLTLNQRRFDFGDFVAGDPNRPDGISNWLTRLEVTVPVYTGAELSSRIGQAGHAADAQRLDLRHARQQVAFDAVSAWVDLAAAREQVEVLRTARDTTARHLQLARQYAEQGMIVDAEVLKAEVFLAEVEEHLVQARTGAELAEAALNFRLGADQSRARRLAATPDPDPASGALDDWIATALEQRADLVAARRRLEAGRLEERAARSGYLPEVGVIGRYDLYDDVPFGANGHNGSVMAVAKINLYRGGTDSSRVAAARHQTSAFEADIERFEDGVRLEVRQAWQHLATARARLDTATSSVGAAREALRIVETRFRQGLDRMIDLLDAETALREAQMRQTVARYDVARETYRLRYVTGSPVIEDMEEL